MNVRRYLRPAAYVRFVDHAVTSYFESKQGQRALQIRYPELKALSELGDQKRKELLPFYEEYVSTISLPGPVISLELASFLWVMCEIIKPKSMLDLRSGFSSFVLRRYASEANPTPVVWSIDEDERWLEKTRQFLYSHQMLPQRLETWQSFAESNRESFDLILQDLTMGLKIQALGKILTLLRPGGVAVLDDISDHLYRAHAKRIIKRANHEYISRKWCTRDRSGRYSALVAY